MIKKVFFIIVVLLLFISSVDVYASGGTRNGTSGAQELLIPVGARGLALNGSFITGISGIEAIFYNPAGLGASRFSTEAMFSRMNHIADIGVSYAALAVNFESLGALGFSLKSLDFGEIPVTTVEAPQGTGATFSPTFVTIGLTYSNALTDRIRAGVNFKFVTERIMRVSSSVFAFDAGVQYQNLAGINGLQIGVVLKNLGPQGTFSGADLLRKATASSALTGEKFYAIEAESYELPSQLELGVAYEQKFMNDLSATFSSTFSNNNFANDDYKLGAELNYQDLLFLRGGYKFSPDKRIDDEEIYGLTLGAGVHYNVGIDLTIDYAYRYVKYFDANHVFQVKFGF